MSWSQLSIRHENGKRNVYKQGECIATILDHRDGKSTDRHSTIPDNWCIAWRTGRFDWHSSLSDALDNVRKA